MLNRPPQAKGARSHAVVMSQSSCFPPACHATLQLHNDAEQVHDSWTWACVVQAAFESALVAFAPGLGAGKFLNAAFARAWKADRGAAAQAVS
jgi:hypothetical protein